MLLAVLIGSGSAHADTAALQREALQLVAEHRASTTDAQRGRLHVSAALEQVYLREARVRIGDGPQQTYLFSEVEARALNAGGLHPWLALDAGTHRIRATLIAREANSRPDARRTATQIDQTLTLPAAAMLELRLQPGGTFAAPRLELLTIAREVAQTRAARYLEACDRPFAAAIERGIVELQAAAAAPVAASTARYNAAIAQLAHEPLAAMRELQAIGAEKVEDPAGLALRDLANLSLAQAYLQRGEPDMARKLFAAVRSPGPYSNAATLGLGWSHLLPAGETAEVPALRAANAEALTALRAQVPFAALDTLASGSRVENLRHALVPWSELIGRDPLDPAVQEGMLALPYALDHLGAYAQARDRYRQAIGRLESSRAQLQAARRQIDDGSLLARLAQREADASGGWARLLVTSRSDPDAVPLRQLAADPAVAEALRAYRALAVIEPEARELWTLPADAPLAARAAALRARLDAAQARAAAELRGALHAELARLDAQTGRYLAEAHFALARSHDLAAGPTP